MFRIGSFIFLLGLVTNLYATAPQAEVFALCYHTFSDRPNDPYDIPLDQFAQQLDELKKLGYRFVTPEEFENGTITGKKNILITIDDGNRSVIDAFEKVLRPRGIKPVLFIYAHVIGKKDYALRWDELEKLAKAGAVIGAHGYFHDLLSTERFTNEPAEFKQEVVNTPQAVMEKTGHTVTLFSYPFGVTSAPALKALAATGYRYAFTLINRPIPIPVPEQERLLLPRYMVTRDNWKSVLAILNRVVAK